MQFHLKKLCAFVFVPLACTRNNDTSLYLTFERVFFIVLTPVHCVLQMFQVVQRRRALYMQAANCVEEQDWKHILNKVCVMNKNRLQVYHPGAYIRGHWLW